MKDQVRPGHRDTRSTGSVDQIHPGHTDPPKIISRCSRIFVEDLHVNRLSVDSNKRSMNDKINRGFLLRICMWTDWPQIQIEDLWVTRSIADSCWGSACDLVEQGIDGSRGSCSDLALIVQSLLWLPRGGSEMDQGNQEAGL